MKLKFPTHCPICGSAAGVEYDEPFMQVENKVIVWMGCKVKEHRFTYTFEVPEGHSIGLLIPGVSPRFQIKR